VTITATPKKCEGAGDYDYVFSEYTVSGNIEAPYVDIGARYGWALPPRRLEEVFYIDLRANLGTQNLRELNVDFSWDAEHLNYFLTLKGIDLEESTEFEYSKWSNELSIKVKNVVDPIVYPSNVIFASVEFKGWTSSNVVSTLRANIQTFKRQTTSSGVIESLDNPGTATIGKLHLNPSPLKCIFEKTVWAVFAGTEYYRTNCLTRGLYRGGTGESCPCADDFYGSDFGVIRPASPPPPPPLPPPPLPPPSPPTPPPYPGHPPPWSPPMSLEKCGNVTDIKFGPTAWSYNPWAMDSIVGVNRTQMNIYAQVSLDTGVVINLPDPTGEYKASDYITLSTILDDEDCEECTFSHLSQLSSQTLSASNGGKQDANSPVALTIRLEQGVTNTVVGRP